MWVFSEQAQNQDTEQAQNQDTILVVTALICSSGSATSGQPSMSRKDAQIKGNPLPDQQYTQH